MNEDECLQIYLEALRLKKNKFILTADDIHASIRQAGLTLEKFKESIHQLLQDHPEKLKEETVEALLSLVRIVEPPPDYALILAKLLLATNHQRNEDIAHTLQQMKDPRTVEFLYQGALTIHDHLHYDEFFDVARKCTWALADIGTPEAYSNLQSLAKVENQLIADYAQKRIDKWEQEKPRKLNK